MSNRRALGVRRAGLNMAKIPSDAIPEFNRALSYIFSGSLDFSFFFLAGPSPPRKKVYAMWQKRSTGTTQPVTQACREQWQREDVFPHTYLMTNLAVLEREQIHKARYVRRASHDER